jgi:acyl-CoA synthetase (NDP forming)
MMIADLSRLYEPSGIAFVGASEKLETYNGRTLQYAINSGFEGGLYPVNPRYETLFGRRCYADLESIEGPLDVVVALVGAHRLPSLFEASRAKGVEFLVVIGDLSPGNAQDNSEQQRALVSAGRNGGPRILGPQCAGIYSPCLPLAAGIASALQIAPAPAGGIGVISQSGGVIGCLIDRARLFGTGFSRMASTGGEVDIGTLDHLQYMIADPETQCICLYFEELTDYGRFFALAEQARGAGKPLIAMKAGRSQAAAGAMQSHSGRICGQWDIQAAAFRRHGIVIARDVDDLHIAASLLARHRVDPDSGIGGASGSGGYSVSLADQIVDHGLAVAEIGAKTKERIAARTGQKHAANPVDAGAWDSIAEGQSDVVETLRALDDDPAVGATVYAEMLFIGMDKIVPDLADFHLTAKKPHVTSVQAGPFAAPTVAALRRAGALIVDNPERALRALALLYDHARLQRKCPPGLPPKRRGSTALSNAVPGLLPAATARALLHEYEIPFVRECVSERAEDVDSLAAQLGYPLVLKAEAAGVAHKTERGFVRTDITDVYGLREALSEMNAMPGTIDAYYLQQRVEGAVEMLVGAKTDPDVGAMVIVGFGGLFAESMAPPVYEFAPFDETAARDLLGRVDPKGILSGYRTGKSLDVEGLARLVSRLSHLVHDHREQIAELDLNPVMVGEADSVAVDVLVFLR